LTYARNRRRWGQEIPWQRPSRFLKEIPEGLIEQPEEVEYQEVRPMLNLETRRPAAHTKSKKKSQQAVDAYPMGARVYHATFGEGMIIHKEGQGEGLRLLVNFEDVGQKLLLASYAKLKILSY
jgi:DNA helicase-2/ATP-dependent DNA helicase PcrA